ncbi:NVEALA domain-containing protein [Parabacteroides chinchillae]|uniref:NVEALA protein n=1 Tax=Parabacteroides chinchillae TaxID=871327 RepID=A0A8G2F5M1_9BACT|nr:NVEALA domain-containing protein [Parabacteroides chinchillae]SEG29467.1 NVEALA protein [Parabacteroides chinchillae]
MKKKLFGIAIVAIVAVGTAWNVNENKNEVTISNLVLANMEALASGEGDINPLCPNGCVDNGTGCYCYMWHSNLQEYR